MLNSKNFCNLQNDEDFAYGGGIVGNVVHIVAQKRLDGRTFDYVKDPSGFDNDVWIYAGELGRRPTSRARRIDLGRLMTDLHTGYVDRNASKFLQQMKTESFSFINNARKQRHVKPLNEDPTMDRLADLRAHQLIKRYSHYAPDGQPYGDIDAARLNVSVDPGWSENISWNYALPVAYEETDPTAYCESDGNGMAYATNNNMLNFDSHSNWGHRENMLDSNADLIGIGTAYDPSTQRFFLAEDFYDSPKIVPAKTVTVNHNVQNNGPVRNQ